MGGEHETPEHHGPEGEHEEGPGWGSRIFNGLTRGVHIAEGLKDLPKAWEGIAPLIGAGKSLPGIFGGASKLLGGTVGKSLPFVSALLSGAQVGYNGAKAYNEFSEGGYHCDKAWDAVGGTVLGGAGVGLAAAYCTPAAPYAAVGGLALAGGEMAMDAGGAAAGWGFGKGAGFSADQAVGNLARGTFGDKSWGEGVSNMLGGGVGGHIAGTALNALTFGPQLAGSIGSGIASEVGAIGSGIWNGEGAIGGGIHTAGRAIGSGAMAVGSAIGSGASAVGNGAMTAGRAIGSGAMAVGSAIGSGASAVGSAIGSGASAVGNGAMAVGSAVGNGAMAVGSAIGSGVSTVGSAIGSGASAIGSGVSDAAGWAGHAIGSVLPSGW